MTTRTKTLRYLGHFGRPGKPPSTEYARLRPADTLYVHKYNHSVLHGDADCNRKYDLVNQGIGTNDNVDARGARK